MTMQDFLNSPVGLLRAAYKMFVRTDGFTERDVSEQITLWFSCLKKYDLPVVEAAVREWINKNRFKPTPAEIIALMPTRKYDHLVPVDVKRRFEDVGGKKVQTFTCMRCMDSGLIEFEDKERILWAVPCDCPAGHEKYTWGWLSPEAQKEYIRKNGYHGEIVGENWYAMNEELKKRRNAAYAGI